MTTRLIQNRDVLLDSLVGEKRFLKYVASGRQNDLVKWRCLKIGAEADDIR